MNRFSSSVAFLPLVAAFLLAPLPGCGSSAEPPRAPESRREAVRLEVERRAAEFADKNVLVADFYRIHRKLAYPLPVTEIYHPDFHVTGISSYPWEIWMLWDLEQRVFSLGWAAEWTGSEHYRELVRRDISALAGWPDYDARQAPHLSGAHAARLLAVSYASWEWLGNDLQKKIEPALARFVDNRPEWLNDGRLELDTPEKVLAEGGFILHNIPTIAIIGRALAARISGHSLAGKLERHAEALIMAQLRLRGTGYTEAVAYDGYILEFVADWLPGAREEFREQFLADEDLKLMLAQSWLTSTPGNLMNVAPFNDVEPREMPFHASVHAKLAALAGADGIEAWYLSNLPPAWLRSDALAALDRAGLSGPREEEPAGAARSLTSVVLRSGWETSDLAVAVSACEATPGHIQKDNAALIIGSGGKWIIDDPGYQQYVSGLEREFTLGPTAHNYPVIGDSGVQKENKVKILQSGERDGMPHTALDITEGYGEDAGVSRVVRNVWLAGDSLVVVGDLVEYSGKPKSINYNWHANPEAALWLEDGSCLVSVDNTRLWVTCAGSPLEGQWIRLLPGTRGQMTIAKQMTPGGNRNTVWWLFNRGKKAADYQFRDDVMSVGGIRFTVE